ncbi:hypothetical protein, partial [Streptomyces sp. JV190]|uniref:hypothetical protein n=1 Tax=Streptomyces sp. JV190 TaxID=3002533 RepID=UPI002E76B40A
MSHAFHSPLREPVREDFRAVVEGLAFHEPTMPFVSAVTGAVVGAEIAAPGYWVRHVREAVRFAGVLQALPAGGVMVAVQASEAEVLSLLEGVEGRAGVAAVNGPEAVVVSGA